MQQLKRQFFAWILLLLSVQWVVPRELWHSCASHEDTVDHVSADGRLQLSSQHEHCAILELSSPPFEGQLVLPIDFHVGKVHTLIAVAVFQSVTVTHSRTTLGRAPPLG